MKTKNNISIMVLTLAISACVAPGSPTTGNCHDRTVHVTHRPASLDAHPEFVTICPGYTLIIDIVPSIRIDQAETKDDPSNPVPAPWIAKKNATRSQIFIPVLENTVEGTYKYSITIEGVGTLDPRARVKGK